MSKEEAASYFPKPQNTNTQNVWVWVNPSTELHETKDRLDWQWFVSTRGGFFVVFVDGKLATPVCANAAFNPWQALEAYANVSIAQAERMLGPSPQPR
jgi:hypothetical protein